MNYLVKVDRHGLIRETQTVSYDDSGGWYDHVLPPIVSQSNDPANDRLLGNVGLCGLSRSPAR